MGGNPVGTQENGCYEQSVGVDPAVLAAIRRMYLEGELKAHRDGKRNAKLLTLVVRLPSS